MSKQTQKQASAKSTNPGGSDSRGSNPRRDHHDRDHHDEDALHVPKGVSRGTFLFLIGLVIFLMVIWLVPGSLFGIAQGPRNPVVVRFELPSGKVEWKSSDLITRHRSILDAFGVDPFLPFQLGVDGSKPEPQALTRILVLDAIAREAGVEVTDADLRSHLEQTLGFQRATPEDFKNGVRLRGLDISTVEATIRLALRVARLQQLVGYVGAVSDPAKIEEQWHRDNVEFAFDFVTVAAADSREAARAELPDDAELEAWFTKLPDAEKREFRTEEKRTATVAILRDTENAPAALLEAFPEVAAEGAEPTPPDEIAHQYYNRVQWRRFSKPKEESQDGEPVQAASFYAFEEVEETCLREGPMFFALQRWIESLNVRHTNGESPDFAAEAGGYGLDLQSWLEPLTRAELSDVAVGGDKEIANAVFGTPADGFFFASPVALPQGIAVVQAQSRTEPELPPFAEIRERVAEKWIGPRAGELAVERLASLRTGLETFEPELEEGEAPPDPRKQEQAPHHRASAEAFRAAAEGGGLAVKYRDYLNKASPANKDPLADDEERRTLATQAAAFGLYGLEADEVAAPGLSADEKTAFLVRLAGKREVSIDEMTPAQYDRYKTTARQMAIGELGQGLDLEFLRQNYGLWLYEESAEAQAQREERAAEQ